jgi:dicarboxylate/amino acid:cation (Na+ or H+) symporter, DAACS family
MAGGLVLGLLLGLAWPAGAARLQPLGAAFIDAIKMIVMPLVVSSVTLGGYRTGANIRQLGRVALVSGAWFCLAPLCAAVVALAVDRIVQPGAGAGIAAAGATPPSPAGSIDWAGFLLDLIPSNVVKAIADQKLLPAMVFSILFGIALAGIGKAAKPVCDLLEAVLAASFRITRWVVALAPFAAFAMTAHLVATNGLHTLGGLARLVGALYLGLAILVGFFWAVLKMIGDRPLAVTRQVIEPLLLAFATRSSQVALPLHMEKLCAMGMPNRVVSIVLPLGYSFNQDGSVLYEALAVAFIAEAYNLRLDAAALVTIVVTVTIASKGVANVPSGALIVLVSVLAALNLPADAIALIAGIDPIMDMGRSAVNVLGNTVAARLVMRFGRRRRPAEADSPEFAFPGPAGSSRARTGGTQRLGV